ncbi:MAG: pre-peptidase C-terminal domain-containing protein [Myxococcales bacterium]|nr:pre-peptidase C-terminal domain-containing protein [Myxococcales bacterium]MCB9520754.1 pre-peptidase C-terminal domain-containing protein [Myxococcales bacterium]MCB9533471.1 pre-peptidase C-terminal domain-containing protein [Myxococcales bacterium]
MLDLFALALQLATPTQATGLELAQATGPQPIAVGDSVQGQLQRGDTVLASGELADAYTFDGSAGQQVRITMRSPDFDTYFGVTGPAGYSVANDDSPGMGTNSQLILTLPAAGSYRIQATSYRPGAVGAYTLSVDPLGGATGGASASTGGGATQRSGGLPLRPGTTDGALDDSDDRLRSGELADQYVYDGQAGERLSLRLSSSDFDPYLLVRGPGGYTQDNDDLRDGALDAGLDITLPATGRYLVVATSFQPGESGRYALAVTNGEANTVVGQTLAIGRPISGTLSSDDPVRSSGQHVQTWTFRGTAGQSVTLDLQSSAFDTLLTLRTPGGDEQSNDDISQRDTNSRVHANLLESGEYTVAVSSYAPGAVGAYTLTLALADSPTVEDPLVQGEGGGSIGFDQPVSGRLTRRDATLDSGEFVDTYTFTGRAQQGVTISMESTQFDTYLMLRGPGDLTLDNDDGFSQGTNSRLEASLPVDGEYTILATSYQPGEDGRYTLSLVEGTSVQNSARGRVFAILAGISDYSDANDLPYCAEDAEKLGEALQTTGILSDDSIILTNAEVTHDGLERAFRAVAAQATPEDVFLFFYSGHGAYIDSSSELDGRDETLYVTDGHVTDDEVAAWFDAVHARVGIIALDSCFSGGFARDVISRPDRMGIFSSEEDVTSNVASRFEAGGFLSYFLREGISGAADTEPADGIITAGELTQYLHRQWSQHGADEVSETADAAGAYQNLVIDRGSVKVTDVLVYTSR